MKTLSIVITLLFVLFMQAISCRAADTVTVTATGEASLSNATSEEAQKTALQRARVNAVEKACGVKVQAESLVRDFILRGEFIHSVSYGHIISEKVTRWDVGMEQKNSVTPPELSYKVTIMAEVLKEKGAPDPSYRVKVKLNKTIFQAGEDMIIRVSATKPGYLTILNFTADDKVVLLHPNAFHRDSKIEPGKEYQFPSVEDQQGIMKLQVSNLAGHKRDTEYIKVIVTSRPFPLLEEVNVIGQYGIIKTVNLAVTEIARLISSIPVQERAEETVSYEIVSK
jgi:hypothetical protein